MRTTKKRARPLSKLYRVFRAGRRISRHSQKREAIRASHRTLRGQKTSARVDVRTNEGALIYQAHLTRDGRIVAEEL